MAAPERGSKSPEMYTIPVAWVNRLDLIQCRPDLREQIETLDEAEIDYLAEKVGDALQESYRLAVSEVLTEYLDHPGDE